MRKFFAIIMCVLMVACLMPSMAFAEGVEPAVKELTVKDANGDDLTINAVEVSTENELKAAINEKKNVVLKNNITLTSAITIGDSNTTDVTIAIVGNNHKLDGSALKKSGNSEPRTINIYDGTNMTVILKDLTVVGPTDDGGSRGISTGDDINTTLILDNCKVSAKKYAINIYDNIYGKTPTIIVRNTTIDDETLQGYCAFQTWTAETKATFENCTLVGNNWWNSKGDNDFSTIVLYPKATKSTLVFKNCRIEANEIGTKTEGETAADETLLSIRKGTTKANITFEDCNFFVNGQEKTEAAEIKSEMQATDGYKFIACNANGGKIGDAAKVISITDNTEFELPTPTRSGYTFNGWYSGNTKVDSPSAITGDEALELTASWSRIYFNGSSTTTTTDAVTNTTEDKTTDEGSTTGTTQVATTTATVKAETTTETDGTTTTSATVDTTTAAKIVEKAVENKSEEVVVNTATSSTVTETAEGTKTEVALPAETITQVAEKTEAAVTIKSDAAEVKLDKAAVKAVAEAAGTTGEVKLEVKTVAQNEKKVEVDLKMVTSNGNVSDFKGGSVSVTVKLNAALASQPVVCVYIDDNGTYHKVKGMKNADGTFTFETGHFSTYAVMAEEEANQVIAEQTANITKMVNELGLKARSTKTKAGNIKVTIKADNAAIKAIEDLGYTVTYRFSRSTKQAKGYKALIEKAGMTYTDKTGEQGTKYYYKARVMIYDAQGELIAKSALKQCRYARKIK